MKTAGKYKTEDGGHSIAAIRFFGHDLVTVQITEEARRAIIAVTKIEYPTVNLDEGVWKAMSRHLPSGLWEVPLFKQTVEKVERLRRSGESLSDAIIRITYTK